MEKPRITILPPEQRRNEPPRIVLPGSAMPKITIKPEADSSRITNIVARRPVSIEGRHLAFHNQLNASDCGPAMCLNMQELLRVEPPVDSDGKPIDSALDVRRWIAEHWAGSLGPGSHAEQWFSVSDVARYLIDGLGLRSENVKTMQDIDSVLARKGKKFIWGYSDMHFKGFYQNEDGLIYNVDSMQEAPLLSDEDTLQQYANRTFRSPEVARRGLQAVFASPDVEPQPNIIIR